MGQPIMVTETPTTRPGVVRFELNRSLTGMGHERYSSRDSATGVRPVDELARRLFDHGGVESVHVYSNVVTVNLAAGRASDGLRDVVENLFIYYSEGVAPAEP
jgi:Scaffold protein Nfu/NifU N terminal